MGHHVEIERDKGSVIQEFGQVRQHLGSLQRERVSAALEGGIAAHDEGGPRDVEAHQLTVEHGKPGQLPRHRLRQRSAGTNDLRDAGLQDIHLQLQPAHFVLQQGDLLVLGSAFPDARRHVLAVALDLLLEPPLRGIPRARDGGVPGGGGRAVAGAAGHGSGGDADQQGARRAGANQGPGFGHNSLHVPAGRWQTDVPAPGGLESSP